MEKKEQDDRKNSQQSPSSSTSLCVANDVPDGGRHYPQTLNQLLLTSTAMVGASNEQKTANICETDDHERTNAEGIKILREALDACFSDNMFVLKNNLNIIKNAEKNEADVLDALNEIKCNIDPIDQAIGFYKMDGLQAVTPLLHHPKACIRQASIEIIKECCSNNPFCKYSSIGDDVLGRLITLASDSIYVDEQIKAVTAIAAIIRDNTYAFSTFHNHDGFSLLKKGLDSKNSTLIERTTNLIIAIAHTNKSCGELIVKQNVVQKLISLARTYQTWEAEYFILALTALFNSYEGARDICLNDDHLKTYLEDVDSRARQPEFEELVEYAKELSKCMNTYWQEKKKP